MMNQKNVSTKPAVWSPVRLLRVACFFKLFWTINRKQLLLDGAPTDQVVISHCFLTIYSRFIETTDRHLRNMTAVNSEKYYSDFYYTYLHLHPHLELRGGTISRSPLKFPPTPIAGLSVEVISVPVYYIPSTAVFLWYLPPNKICGTAQH